MQHALKFTDDFMLKGETSLIHRANLRVTSYLSHRSLMQHAHRVLNKCIIKVSIWKDFWNCMQQLSVSTMISLD